MSFRRIILVMVSRKCSIAFGTAVLDGNRRFDYVNHKKVYRVYKELGLNLVRKRRRRLASRERQNLAVPERYNEVWSMDFMSHALFNSRRFRTLNIIDDYNRESIWIEIGLSIGALHMTDLLEWIVKERGKPKAIRTDIVIARSAR